MIKKYAIFLSLLSVIYGQISMSGINDELDSIREEVKEAVSLPGEDVLEDDTTTPESVVILSPAPLESTEYFGYNYFKRDITFFDNIPTPSDFKLGPGDEIILSFWGEKNSREDFVINKEGLIYYENVGFINLSNKTITAQPPGPGLPTQAPSI